MMDFITSEPFPNAKLLAVPSFVAARCAAAICNLPKITPATYASHVNQLFLVCRQGWQAIASANPDLPKLYKDVFVSYYVPWVSGPTPTEASSSLIRQSSEEGFSPLVKAWLFAALYFHELTFWGSDIGSATQGWLRWFDCWHCSDPTVAAVNAELEEAKSTAVFRQQQWKLKDWIRAIERDTAGSGQSPMAIGSNPPDSPAALIDQLKLPDDELTLEWLINELCQAITLLDESIETKKEVLFWLDSLAAVKVLPHDGDVRRRLMTLQDSDPELSPRILAYLKWPDSMVVWAELLGDQRNLEHIIRTQGEKPTVDKETRTRLLNNGQYYQCHFRDMKSLCESSRDDAFVHLDGIRQRSPPSWLTVRDLATKHQLPEEALRKRLERWQRKNRDRLGEWFVEKAEPKRGKKWLYREDAVREVIVNHKKAGG